MTNKFQNKYRIPSARAKWWDYGLNANYFITICTAHKEPFFGEIENGIMNFTEIGMIVQNCIAAIPEHFPFVTVDTFVVMPNHVHAILIFNKPIVQTTINKFGPQSQNLAAVVRGFKTGVTVAARKINSQFNWQTRYHDHIIRDHHAYRRIWYYIETNVENWNNDCFHNHP